MPILPFGEYRPDVSDYMGQTSKNIQNVLVQGDGYGPFPSLAQFSTALPSACRGLFYARKNDGSVLVFAGTSNRLFTLNNTTYTWTPVSTWQTCTFSISGGGSAGGQPLGILLAVTGGSGGTAGQAIVTLNSHGLINGDPVQFSNSGGALPTGITGSPADYYVVNATTNTFQIASTLNGVPVGISDTGTGTQSVTGTYSALSTGANWQFAQFNNLVFAVQNNIVPVSFDLTSSLTFNTVGGSPPQAAYVAIVNRFLMLGGIASPNVYRVQWSGLNATTTWTSGVSQSDYQDLADGGMVRAVIGGGEYGIIFQDQAIRRITYAPGSPYIFQIDRISQDDGLLAPYSAINAGDRIFYCSPQGFKMILPGGYPQQIGKERVDRTFLNDVDLNNVQLIIAAHDPRTTKVYWAYKSTAYGPTAFDKILCYDWVLDKWTTISQLGEYLTSLSTPGLTLEQVDAAFGSNIDTLTIPTLDTIGSSTTPRLAGIDTSHDLGYFTGPNLQATLETPEQGITGKRIFVRGFRPISDAATVYGSVSSRENAQTAQSYSSENQVNAIGQVPALVSTRYARGRVRIPAGQAWTFAAGVEPDVVQEGEA